MSSGCSGQGEGLAGEAKEGEEELELSAIVRQGGGGAAVSVVNAFGRRRRGGKVARVALALAYPSSAGWLPAGR